MAILYPGAIDGTAQFGVPSGTTPVDTGPLLHAQQHDNLSSFGTVLENILGTTPGTNLLRNISAASDQLLTANSGGTLLETITKGTANNMIFGSQLSTGGTLQAPTFNGAGTASGTIINGVYNAATLGTPTVQGSVIGSANILDGNVPERKMRMDQLAGTTLTTGTTASQTKVDIVGGSVTITPAVASNVLINFSAAISETGAVPALFTLLLDGTVDSTWNDANMIPGQSPGAASFQAWRIGITAAPHTWKMQWRTSGVGTLTLSAFELIVIPFSQ